MTVGTPSIRTALAVAHGALADRDRGLRVRRRGLLAGPDVVRFRVRVVAGARRRTTTDIAPPMFIFVWRALAMRSPTDRG